MHIHIILEPSFQVNDPMLEPGQHTLHIMTLKSPNCPNTQLITVYICDSSDIQCVYVSYCIYTEYT